jgi:hypothetical protein
MSSGSRLVLVAALTALLASCRTAPLYNVEQSSFNTTEQHSLAEITDAVQQAGARLGWQMNVERPGLIIGTLNLRSHQAMVEIPYDTSGFAIQYQNSTNLNYDGTTIHKNYNSWVQNLEREIRIQVSAL